MKKIYLLALLCFISFSGFAQVTITVYATGGPGSYITGTSNGVTRTEDNIVTSNTPIPGESGYAVFDLSGIPAGATIDAVNIGFYVTGYTGAGAPSSWNTYGYPGDLSGVTDPAALFTDMSSLPATSISTASYGLGTGNQVVPTSAGITSFIAANYGPGAKVSICFTGGGTRTYTMQGESGNTTSIVTPNHAPYLQITYCTVPTAVTATALPNPVCTGQTLTLNGSASIAGMGGTITYTWVGPGGYGPVTGGVQTFPATLTSAGVYSLTATHVCGILFTATASATTTSVTVNPSPAAITGLNAVCVGGTTQLTDATGGGGTWSSSNTILATVNSSALVSGHVVGIPTISYIMPFTGCFAVLGMNVNAPPAAITGPLTAMCQGDMTTLTETSFTGTWGTTNTNIATVVGGVVTGGGSGSGPVIITYTVPGCAPANYPMTINPTPAAITSSNVNFHVCIGPTSPTTMSDASGGGTWMASNADASFGILPFDKNKLYGTTVGIDTVTYTITATGCFITATVSVSVGTGPVTGPSVVCEGSSIVLSDGLPGGGGWTSHTPGIAFVVGGTGVVTGVSGGIDDITYTEAATGCFAIQTVTVHPQPAAIIYPGATPAFCQNDSMQLSDPDPTGKWTSSNTLNAVIDTTTGWMKGVGAGGGGPVSTTISYTFPSTGCSNTQAITVYPSPPDGITRSGPTTFCSGGSVTLSVPSVGGSSYQWYNGGTLIAGANTAAYTTSSTSSLSVQIINSFGCIASSIPEVVISGISPTVDTTGSTHFCTGSDVILKANSNAAVGIITYQWQLNGVNIASAVADNYFANKTGLYTCIVTVSGGGSGSCSAATQTVSVTADPLPTPSITYTRTAGNTKFSTGTGYKTYQWYINSVAIPGAIYSSYTANVNGSYRVWVTDTTNCGGYSAADVINDVSVPQINTDDVKIFPNPATSVLHIESPVSVRAIITGVEGKILLNEANASEINISSLASGMYIIMLYDENGERLKVEKLIKQ